MNRRNFFKLVFGGIAVAALSPLIPKELVRMPGKFYYEMEIIDGKPAKITANTLGDVIKIAVNFDSGDVYYGDKEHWFKNNLDHTVQKIIKGD